MKQLGFGCLRLPLTGELDGEVDQALFKTEANIRPLFQEQLEACGVEYFDCCLMHGLSERLYERFVNCNAFDVVAELKAWNNHGTYVHYTAKYGKASDCIGCGQCEQACLQRLPVRKLLREIASVHDYSK